MTFIKSIYVQETIAAYRSGYLGALTDTMRIPKKHTPQIPIADFHWPVNMLQIYTHRRQFSAPLSMSF